jgi:hypothetical protein
MGAEKIRKLFWDKFLKSDILNSSEQRKHKKHL